MPKLKRGSKGTSQTSLNRQKKIERAQSTRYKRTHITAIKQASAHRQAKRRCTDNDPENQKRNQRSCKTEVYSVQS